METRKSSCTSLQGPACPSGEHANCSNDFETHAFSDFLFDTACFGSGNSPLEDGSIFEPSKYLDVMPDPKSQCIHESDTLDNDHSLDFQSNIWPGINTCSSNQSGSWTFVPLPSNSSSWMFRQQDINLGSPNLSESSMQHFQGLDMAKSTSRSSSQSSYDSFTSDQSQSVVSAATPSGGDYCMGCLSKAFEVPNFSYCQPSYVQQIQSTPASAPPPLPATGNEHAFCISPGNDLSLPSLSPHTTFPPSPPAISLSSTPAPPPHTSSLQSKKRKRGDGNKGEPATDDSTLAPIRTKAMKDGGHNCYSGSHWEGPEIWTPEKMEQSKPKKRKTPAKRTK